jgi:hypothetical protein
VLQGSEKKSSSPPLPRYIKKCCDSYEHLANRSNKKKFVKKLGEAVGETKDSIRDLIFGKKIRSFQVLSPLLLIAGDDNEEEVQDDPVHLTKEGYAALLKKILARTRALTGQALLASPTAQTRATRKTPRSTRGRPGSTLTTQRPTGTTDGAPEEVAGDQDDLGVGDPTEERDAASAELGLLGLAGHALGGTEAGPTENAKKNMSAILVRFTV